MRRVALISALVAAIVGALLGALLDSTPNAARHVVRGSSTRDFVAPLVQHPPAVSPRRLTAVPWPTFGYDSARLKSAPSFGFQPPYRVAWAFSGGSLLEFPPAIGYGRLYFTTNHGLVYALDADSGRVAWRWSSGRCAAASPALAQGLVIVVFLNRLPCNASSASSSGGVVAFDARTGGIRWRRSLGPSESSPLILGGVAYVGDWRGDVYALSLRDGRVRWRFHTSGRVKGAGAAVGAGRVVFGAYDGHLYALDARTGRLAWRSEPTAGSFYSTPAVAHGRVYVGSTDGFVYSFSATTGRLEWAQRTGGYVYGSPALWRQTVFIGSYDGSLYALDAATGAVRWRVDAGGPISGSPVVLGTVLYVSTLAEQTFALDARTGAKLWSFPDGKYTPVVVAPGRLYLVGYNRLFRLVEHESVGRLRRGRPPRR